MIKRYIKEPYVKINLILAGIIVLIIIYSGLFSPEKANHPIPSNFTIITKNNTTSTGLSRAFSAIVRLNFSEAKQYNKHSLRIFGFLIVQLLLRIGFIPVHQFLQKKKLIIVLDITISVVLFILAFSVFFKEFFKMLSG